jgi:hypothetical protein
MGCIIKYKGQSIPEEQFLQYLNKQIAINQLFESDSNLAHQVYEALGFEIPTTKLQGKQFEYGEPRFFDVVEELTSGERASLPSSILINKLLKGEYLPEIKESQIILGLSEAGIWRPNIKKIEASGENKSTLAKKIGHELLHSVTNNIILSYQNLKGTVDFTDKYYKDFIKQGYIKPVDLSKSQIEALDNLVRIRNKVISYVEQNKDKIQKQDRGFGTYDYFIRTNYTESETDLHEFISEVFTNPELINILKEIPTEGKKSNLFKDFVDAIAKILGFTNTSILEDIIAYSEEAFFQQPQLAPQQKQQALQVYSQYLDTIFPDSKVKDIVYHGSPKISKNNVYERLNLFQEYQDGNITEEEYENAIKKFPENPLIEQFDKSKIGSQSNSGLEKGFYFTSNKKVATFSSNRIYNIILDIQSPKTLDYKKDNIDLAHVKSALQIHDHSLFDGLILENIIDSFDKDEAKLGNTYVVFEPEQIHILGSKQDIEGFKQFVKSPTISKEVEQPTVKVDELKVNLKKIEKDFEDYNEHPDVEYYLKGNIGKITNDTIQNLCDMTSSICLSFLHSKGINILQRPFHIYPTLKIANFKGSFNNHKVAISYINNKMYIFDMPQNEYITLNKDNKAVFGEFKPRFIEVTPENMQKYYGIDAESYKNTFYGNTPSWYIGSSSTSFMGALPNTYINFQGNISDYFKEGSPIYSEADFKKKFLGNKDESIKPTYTFKQELSQTPSKEVENKTEDWTQENNDCGI